MSELVWYFNPLDLIVDSRKAIDLAKWGSKCKNRKTRLRILKSCIKIINKSSTNKNAIKLGIKPYK